MAEGVGTEATVGGPAKHERSKGHRKGASLKARPVETRRRCAATGTTASKADLLRFVVSPEGGVVPDLAEILPGRGIWLSVRRDVIELATRKKVFSRVARRRAEPPPDLADRVGVMLKRRCLDLLGFARRAGLVAAGFDQVKAAAKAGSVVLLLEAADGAEDGRRKIAASLPGVEIWDAFSAAELAAALGRDHVVHVSVSRGARGQGSLIARLKSELERLGRYEGRGNALLREATEGLTREARGEPER